MKDGVKVGHFSYILNVINDNPFYTPDSAITDYYQTQTYTYKPTLGDPEGGPVHISGLASNPPWITILADGVTL